MSRRSTPDVLGEIMGSQPESGKAIKPANNKDCSLENGIAVELASNMAISQENHKAIKLESNKAITEEEPKEKATFNLSIAILEELEDTWISLKRAAKGKRVTKTLIVEKALSLAIQDYERRGEDSDIFKSI